LGQKTTKIKVGLPSRLRQRSPRKDSRMNPNKKKYSKIVEQCKQAETIILGNAELVLAHETLSQEGREELEEIKRQTWRIDKLMDKIE